MFAFKLKKTLCPWIKDVEGKHITITRGTGTTGLTWGIGICCNNALMTTHKIT